MPQKTPSSPPALAAAAAIEPARTHAEAAVLLRRPFAAGAVGLRAMTKVTLGGVAYGGATVAAYIQAQSVIQRLNAVVPGRWSKEFHCVPAELVADSKKLYLACRLTITLPREDGGPAVDAVYEDIGEVDKGSFAGLKALYSDARKRAGVAAGIGAYLYTALAPVVLAIGDNDQQVRAVRRSGKPDLLEISSATAQWLREGYQARMETPAVRRDLGEMLSHGEPETGMGQGEAEEQAGSDGQTPTETPAGGDRQAGAIGNGAVSVDFAGVGPAAAA